MLWGVDVMLWNVNARKAQAWRANGHEHRLDRLAPVREILEAGGHEVTARKMVERHDAVYRARKTPATNPHTGDRDRRAQFWLLASGGLITAWTAGVSRLSSVTIITPVSTTLGTGLPCR
jgi:hypothetical protein